MQPDYSLKNIFKEVKALFFESSAVKAQRENMMMHHAYALLEQKAASEGNEAMAMRYHEMREDLDPPVVSDTGYAGSSREWQDMVDGEFKAKELAEGVAQEEARRGVPIHAKHEAWMKTDLMPFLQNKPESKADHNSPGF